jgi:hypothetical protein
MCEPPAQAPDLLAMPLELTLARALSAKLLAATNVTRDLTKHLVDLLLQLGAASAREHMEWASTHRISSVWIAVEDQAAFAPAGTAYGPRPFGGAANRTSCAC